MGIETIAAGSYVTACGKVDGSCRRGEPKKITSSNPLINYFKSESANRFLYYDKRSKMFKQVWMSD